MAFATWLASVQPSGSGLARALKVALTASALALGALTLAACQTGPGEGTVVQPGAPGVPGPDGRLPRPDVNPLGAEGPEAYGAPRTPSAGYGALKVALLVPQSGGEKARGDALFDAAQMALFDTGRSDISLIVKDTSGGASNAAQSAINEGAQIILGPVFSHEVPGVRMIAAPYGVPVITFSSDSSVAGGGVYLMSFPMEDEIRTVVNYAASRGMGLFAVMSPADAYARRAEAEFSRDVAAIGGQIIASATYSAAGPGYSSVMQLDNKDFDAIFIPGGKSGLREIAGLIRFGPPAPKPPEPLTPEQIAAGMTPPPPPPPPQRAVLPDYILLGTGLWSEPANGSAGGLVNGVFAAPDPYMHSRFNDRFKNVYGNVPPSIASLGYDAMALAATLSGGMPGQQFTAAAITDPNGFAGVDGIFRFLPNGQIQRGLAILQVSGAGFSTIRPAHSTFQNYGF